jgi:putative ubiquitin-RnfH superfamily antitoxin RatB of RatAB toxin-antitoxin module
MSEAASDEQRPMRIEVAYALPDRQYVELVLLPAGACVADALAAVADRTPFSGLALNRVPIGVHGEVVTPEHALCDHDRVEVYRPLRLDPLEARRRRGLDQASSSSSGGNSG